MIVKYTPAGEQAREFEWDGGSVRAAEAELIEATFESTFSDWNYQVMMGSIRARRILLWRMLCKEPGTARCCPAGEGCAGGEAHSGAGADRPAD